MPTVPMQLSNSFNCPVARPLLRWAGSKRKQLARLSPFWRPHHRRYIEPFAGSACLFFELSPVEAVLGDNNSQLIELYRVVQKDPECLHRRICAIPRTEEAYLRWRALDAKLLDRETRALRLLYLNRNCFNGIYRTNSAGQFNVPLGSRLGKYPSRSDMIMASQLLKKTTLIAGDFSKTLANVREDDFVYLDPPYAVLSRRIFREYGEKAFDTSDIPRFASALDQIVARGADFIVSYADSKEARELAGKWHSTKFPVRRHVAGFAGDRRRAYEWIISNQPIPELVTS
jgi:DNA adenine methylase